MNYKFGAKNQWRRRLWSQIADVTKNRKDAVVLYLAGPQDLDREVAVRHGFSPANLIAVDADRAVVAALRKRGSTAIYGRLDDVMANWPADWPVSVVLADFVSGLHFHVLRSILIWSFAPQFKSGVMAVNLQRGRDEIRYTNGDVMSFLCQSDKEFIGKIVSERSAEWGVNNKNRAIHALAYRDAFVNFRYKRAPHYFYANEIAEEQVPDEVRADFLRAAAKKWWVDNRVAYFCPESYKSASGKVFMDSVCFYQEFVYGVDEMIAAIPRDKDLARMIGAARAITTMRRRGDLGGGRPSRIAA